MQKGKVRLESDELKGNLYGGRRFLMKISHIQALLLKLPIFEKQKLTILKDIVHLLPLLRKQGPK